MKEEKKSVSYEACEVASNGYFSNSSNGHKCTRDGGGVVVMLLLLLTRYSF